MENSNNVYVVEAILDNKKERNKYFFLVKWVGYEETTWEPLENIKQTQVLKEYMKKTKTCVVCEKVKTKTDKKWQQCCGCIHWQHVECTTILQECSFVKWFCPLCVNKNFFLNKFEAKPDHKIDIIVLDDPKFAMNYRQWWNRITHM